jgi:hypothetical protein
VAEAGVIRRVVVPLVLVSLTALGLLNTYGDSTGVEKLAADTACGGTPCPVEMREFTRSPFSHEYVYQLTKRGDRVVVKCAREYIFVGDYRCNKQ